MIPVNQTVLHDPENGKEGNCFSAVLASLLHLPIDKVPTFQSEDWNRQVNDFLRPYGLAYLQFSATSIQEYFDANAVQGCYHELAGKTTRHLDVLHSVAALNGAVVHDPHPDHNKSTFTSLETGGLFIVLKPWSHTRQLTHSGECLNDPYALAVCEGTFADKCDEVNRLVDTLRAISTISYDPDVIKMIDEALVDY